MCVTICGRFCLDEGAVAGYGNRIRVKSSSKAGRADCGNDFSNTLWLHEAGVKVVRRWGNTENVESQPKKRNIRRKKLS